ncbi:MAG: AMP-binding protein [Candidatus Lokiarchaeota archaeon]|nr:AMP-binding protein [Candidatus Lokiarchaeota archaeon]
MSISIDQMMKMLSKQLGVSATTTFGEVVKTKAEKVGDKVFLTFVRDFDKGIDEKYTYRDMHVLSNRLANGLLKLGIKQKNGISIFQINSPEYLFVLFAAFKMGCYCVLVNTGLKGDGLQYIIDHSDSNVLVIHWSLIERYLNIKDQLPKIEHVIVDINEAPADFELPGGAISLQSVMDAPDDDINIKIDPKDMSVLIYTSGTTGLPKATTFFYGKSQMGGALTYSALIAYGMGRPGDTFFTCLPLFHGNALQLTTMPGYFAEFPVILSKRFSASRFWDIIRKYEVTCFNLLGSMPQYLLKQPKRSNDKDNKVWRVNSAACPRELIVDFEERFNVKMYEGYGAVDGGSISNTLGTFGRKNVPVGTMGKPPEGSTAEIVDDGGNILEPNEVGELVFLVKEEDAKETQVNYYKDEKSSKARVQRGPDGRAWFHTGDLAIKDEDGWFFFVDRKKDSIRRKGENISPFTIERAINQNEKVLESAAYGIKSSQVGEDYAEDEVMVAVVMKPGETITPEELLDFCQDKLASFQLPRFIEFVEALPKSEVHRIMKRFLKERGVSEKTYDCEKAGYHVKKD